jgi:hypothetical protein
VFNTQTLLLNHIADCAEGTITAWINYRGATDEQPYFHDSGIIMHPIPNSQVRRDHMSFGRIRGTRKLDFITSHKDTSMKLYENRGYQGTAYGERCRYCDMTNSGSDSYLSIGPCRGNNTLDRPTFFANLLQLEA